MDVYWGDSTTTEGEAKQMVVQLLQHLDMAHVTLAAVLGIAESLRVGYGEQPDMAANDEILIEARFLVESYRDACRKAEGKQR